MMYIKKGLLAGAALALSAGSAANATVYIAYKYGAGPLTVVATDPTDASWSGTLAPNLKVTTTTGSTGGYPSVLGSNVSIKYTGNAGPMPSNLDIFVTVDNLSSFLGYFDTGLTENQLVGSWSITESTFFDATNALFGGTLLASNMFNGPTPNTAKYDATSLNMSLTGPYSVTHQYHVVAPTNPNEPTGSMLSTISVTANAVPEPATWAMMLVGFGVAGATYRRRHIRTELAAA